MVRFTASPRMTSGRFTDTAVEHVEKLEVVQRTTQRVGVVRTWSTNDEIVRTRATWETLATYHVEVLRAADRLGVDDHRQRGQE